MSQTTIYSRSIIQKTAIAASVVMLAAFTTKKENTSTKGDPEPTPAPWAWGDSGSEVSNGSYVNNYPNAETRLSATFFYNFVTKKTQISALLDGCTFVASADIPNHVENEYGLNSFQGGAAYIALICSGGMENGFSIGTTVVQSELMPYVGWGANSNAAEIIDVTRRTAQMLSESLAFGVKLELVADEKEVDHTTGEVLELHWETGFECSAINFAGQMDMTLLEAAAE